MKLKAKKNTLKIADQRNSISVAKGVMVAVCISLVLVLLFAFLLKFTNIPESTIKPVNQVIKGLSILMGVFVGLKRKKELGLVSGLLIGLIYTIVAFLVFSCLGGVFAFDLTLLTDLLFGAVMGAICGIICVNLKKSVNFDYSYNSGTRTAKITVVMVADQIVVNTFTPFVAHEIRHHHQIVKSDCLTLNTKQFEKLKAAEEKNKTNPFLKMLKHIAYCSQESEQEAYGQELYHELCLLKPTQYFYALEDCNAYKVYKRMEKYIAFIEKYKKNSLLYNSLHSLGYDVDIFIDKAKKSCKNFLRRLGRIVALYEKNKERILSLGENVSYDEYIH